MNGRGAHIPKARRKGLDPHATHRRHTRRSTHQEALGCCAGAPAEAGQCWTHTRLHPEYSFVQGMHYRLNIVVRAVDKIVDAEPAMSWLGQSTGWECQYSAWEVVSSRVRRCCCMFRG